MIDKYDGFIFDLDGTLYLGEHVIEGAAKTIHVLRELNKKLVFVSNKTTGTLKDYSELLKSHGLRVDESEIINSTKVIKSNLTDKNQTKFFAIGEQTFINELTEIGMEYSTNPNEVEIVFVTLDRTFNYDKLEIAAKALVNGAKFYAANIDNTCPVEYGEIIDAGSIISALEKRTNKKLDDHFGKPSSYMFSAINNYLNIPLEKCLIIGDRLETDIAMGNIFGIDTALVSTGVKIHLNGNSEIKPTYKIDSVQNLIK